jgi:hypothetical protein
VRKLKLLMVAVTLAIPTMVVATPAQACMGEVCDAANWVCGHVKGWTCVA